MSDDLLTASDLLPARPSGEWAREKLYYLARYMEIFTTGQKNRWTRRAYIDLMAGPGVCKIRPAGDEFDGSPLIALNTKTPFTHAVFVELDGECCQALNFRCGAPGLRPDPLIIHGDCNDQAVIGQIRQAAPGDALTLAFVDNLGLNVTFETLKALTRERRIDLVITFQVQDLVRNVRQALEAGGDLRLSRFFGSSRWIDRVAGVQPSEYASALTDFYLEQLGTIDYCACEQLHVLMRNSCNAPLYRLILAGKHPRAVDYFRKISTIEHTGQRNLFAG